MTQNHLWYKNDNYKPFLFYCIPQNSRLIIISRFLLQWDTFLLILINFMSLKHDYFLPFSHTTLFIACIMICSQWSSDPKCIWSYTDITITLWISLTNSFWHWTSKIVFSLSFVNRQNIKYHQENVLRRNVKLS